MKKPRRRRARIVALLLGLGLLLFGSLFVVYYGRVQHLTCTRLEPSQIECKQQVSWFKLIPLGAAQSIESVQSAVTEEHCYTDSQTSTYECQDNGVKLITPTSEFPLSSDFFSTETAQATVDRLNQFIQDSNETTVALDSSNSAMAVLGLGCVALTLLLSGALVLIAWR